jgi:hypothetical protein
MPSIIDRTPPFHAGAVDAGSPEAGRHGTSFGRDHAFFPLPCSSRCFSSDKKRSTIKGIKNYCNDLWLYRSLPDLFSKKWFCFKKMVLRAMDMPAARADRQSGDPDS